MARMNRICDRGAERFGSMFSLAQAYAVFAACAVLLVALLTLAGCKGKAADSAFAPAPLPPGAATSPLVPAAPTVLLDVQSDEQIFPGNVVEISLNAGGERPIAAYRLSIDGANSGWAKRSALKDHRFVYTWTAGQPGLYEIVGEAKDEDGHIGRSQLELTVNPPAEDTAGPVSPGPTPAPPATLPRPVLARGDYAFIGPAAVTEWSISLPTYPVEAYQTNMVDPVYRWPFRSFDRERFLNDAPAPGERVYRVIVLENAYLQVLILPELGGRVWQVIHKPSDSAMFYQNAVVKPSPWGPDNQLGWYGLGGIEWNLPVNEHGYDWGTPWDVQAFVDEDGAAVAQIATPDDGRLLAATVTVTLPPGAAYFKIEPRIRNISDQALQFDYWQTAMLAPGPANRPSEDLRFIVPGEAVRIHSTGDPALPGPGGVIPWPVYGGRDLSRLGEWDQYVGFFEYPAAHGPFVGVYEPASDVGAVRVYPAGIAQGSKVFGLGWRDALVSEYFTDDASAYVELHGGLAPTFTERAQLAAGESIGWEERWYPVTGIGEFVVAGGAGALTVAAGEEVYRLAFYAVEQFAGRLSVMAGDREVMLRAIEASPEMPYRTTLPLEDVIKAGAITVMIEDEAGAAALAYTMEQE
jgi:hypothetical protein